MLNRQIYSILPINDLSRAQTMSRVMRSSRHTCPFCVVVTAGEDGSRHTPRTVRLGAKAATAGCRLVNAIEMSCLTSTRYFTNIFMALCCGSRPRATIRVVGNLCPIFVRMTGILNRDQCDASRVTFGFLFFKWIGRTRDACHGRGAPLFG